MKLWERMKGVEQFSIMKIHPSHLVNEQCLLLIVKLGTAQDRWDRSPVPESSGEGNQGRVCQARAGTVGGTHSQWNLGWNLLLPIPRAFCTRAGVSSLPFGDPVPFNSFKLGLGKPLLFEELRAANI